MYKNVSIMGILLRGNKLPAQNLKNMQINQFMTKWPSGKILNFTTEGNEFNSAKRN